MTQLRKSILGFVAALAALAVTLVFVSRSEEGQGAVAERTAPGPSA